MDPWEKMEDMPGISPMKNHRKPCMNIIVRGTGLAGMCWAQVQVQGTCNQSCAGHISLGNFGLLSQTILLRKRTENAFDYDIVLSMETSNHDIYIYIYILIHPSFGL